MKHDTHDRDRQQAAEEYSQRHAQARSDTPVTKDQDFYARLGLSGVEPKASNPDAAFVVSIYCERWTQRDLEAGEASSHDIELDHVAVDADELVQHGRDYGLSEPSCSDPRMSPEVWFRSTFPPEDRAYFEQGVQKYYSLHIHEVNSHPPTSTDYQRIANLINVRFEQTFQLQDAKQEGPDLCL